MESAIEVINKCTVEEYCDVGQIENLVKAYRELRCLCAFNSDHQDKISENIEIIRTTRKLLFELVSKKNKTNEETTCLVVGLQFLANFLVNNKKNQIRVWLTCQDLLLACLKLEEKNEKVQHCCLMIIYNIFLGNEDILSGISQSLENIINMTANENLTEYALYIIDLFIMNSTYLERFYETLTPSNKIILLSETKTLINDIPKHENLLLGTLNFFTKKFSEKSDWILNKIKGNEDYQNVVEIVKLLDVLVAFSSDDSKKYLNFMQKDTSFLINCASMLKAIHMLSKEKGNQFTVLSKLSEVTMEEENLSNPVIGFKSDIVRIVGNLCWKNRKCQDIVRDLECVQVILDCCVIDGKNPFITQWSILAIRNICENNAENQQIICQLSRGGIIDANSLHDWGIVLDSNPTDDSALCMAPLCSNS